MRNEEIELELVVAFSNGGRNNLFHPTRDAEGEVLLPGYICSTMGFLLCSIIVEVQVNEGVIHQAMDPVRTLFRVVYEADRDTGPSVHPGLSGRPYGTSDKDQMDVD